MQNVNEEIKQSIDAWQKMVFRYSEMAEESHERQRRKIALAEIRRILELAKVGDEKLGATMAVVGEALEVVP